MVDQGGSGRVGLADTPPPHTGVGDGAHAGPAPDAGPGPDAGLDADRRSGRPGPASQAAAGGDEAAGHPRGGAARTRAFRGGVLTEENFPLSDVDRFRGQDDVVVWLDLCAPDAEQLHLVADELRLDPHAVEDALSAGERAKLDRYPTHLFLNTYAVRLDVASGELVSQEISAFIAGRTLVTVRGDDTFDLDEVLRRVHGADLAAHGVAYLVHGIIDVVVDGYFTAVQALDGALEDLEDMLFDEDVPEGTVHRRSFELRKSLVQLRREILPMREAVNSLMRRDTGLVTDGLVSAYQDVYDHVLRATEWTDSLRDMINSILDTNLTIQSNRLNLVMKKMTGWAAIIAVPTLITGFFGQNVPYPGSGESWGFSVDLFVLVLSAAILYVVFRRKGWL